MSCVALPNVDCIAAIAQVHFGEHTRYGYSAYCKRPHARAVAGPVYQRAR